MTTTDRELLIQALAALDAVRLADLGYHIDLPDIIRQHLATPAVAGADLDAIRAKAETFFEWPDDAGEQHRDYVTFTSCLLFARACIEDWQAKHQDILQRITHLEKSIAITPTQEAP